MYVRYMCIVRTLYVEVALVFVVNRFNYSATTYTRMYVAYTYVHVSWFGSTYYILYLCPTSILLYILIDEALPPAHIVSSAMRTTTTTHSTCARVNLIFIHNGCIVYAYMYMRCCHTPSLCPLLLGRCRRRSLIDFFACTYVTY